MPEPTPTRVQCPKCQSLAPNAECPVCVADQVQREIATVADLQELQDD